MRERDGADRRRRPRRPARRRALRRPAPARLARDGARAVRRRCCCSTSRRRSSTSRTRWRCSTSARSCTSDGRTLVAVLHDLNHACRYATHLIAMREGAIVAQGDPREIVDAELVEAVFGLRCLVVPVPGDRRADGRAGRAPRSVTGGALLRETLRRAGAAAWRARRRCSARIRASRRSCRSWSARRSTRRSRRRTPARWRCGSALLAVLFVVPRRRRYRLGARVAERDDRARRARPADAAGRAGHRSARRRRGRAAAGRAAERRDAPTSTPPRTSCAPSRSATGVAVALVAGRGRAAAHVADAGAGRARRAAAGRLARRPARRAAQPARRGASRRGAADAAGVATDLVDGLRVLQGIGGVGAGRRALPVGEPRVAARRRWPRRGPRRRSRRAPCSSAASRWRGSRSSAGGWRRAARSRSAS